jgi:small subunit ribosomal protein S21
MDVGAVNAPATLVCAQTARLQAAPEYPSCTGLAYSTRKEPALKVFVRDNNVDQALRVLKKKLQREGLFRELKRRKAYEKPSERRAREKGEAIRRGRKAARKLAEREGLIAKPRIRRPVFGRR